MKTRNLYEVNLLQSHDIFFNNPTRLKEKCNFKFN